MAITLPAAVERNYRFLVLFASLGLMLMGTGSMFLMSVLLKPIAQDFGWTRSIPSLAFSALYIGGGLGGIVMGIWMDRRGMGRPALVAALMVSAGTFMASRVQSEWDLYLVYGVMLGLLGQGALFSPLMANIIRWFEHKRGTAVGVVASGQSLAGAMWPPLIRYVNEAEGWRETFVWFSGLAFIVMVPLSMIMWRAAPGTEERAAARAAQRVEREQGGARRRPVAPGATVLSPAGLQWLLSAAIVFCCIAMSLPLAHIVAHATDIGHPAARAAEMLSIALAMSFFSRFFGIGMVANKRGGLTAVFVFSFFQMLGLFFLGFVDGMTALYLTAALFGFGYGGIVPSYPLIVREYLPAHEGGRRTAYVVLFGALGMAIGGWLGGFVFDLTGSYKPAFVIGFLVNVLNLIIIGGLLRRARTGKLTVALA